ncbi:hybrid sensor histidine kinase/response regulator [Candidatus Marithioploca araucensis]|uniref:histidine kinase n=1 Tax=Candidatus Marithioploca araucensis TaxID=70273 RepID=A0ABT7VQK6_9GAMM|nr:hybrid sensor histidine kinase/response regulator [Candidatus Marithioploca araucensis]
MIEKQYNILIVDDEPLNLKTLGNILTENYGILIAKDGKQALIHAFDEPQPDLILLDIMMPGLDGYEICRILQADIKTQHIPIIFVSALNEEIDETKGLEMGAVDYITKPISNSIVLARVKTQLKLKSIYEKLKAANEELAQKNIVLKEVAALREDVERITRHDLKNPLNGILGAVSIFMDDDEELNEEQRDLTKIIEEAGYQMLDMINNSLNLYKMEIGRYQYHPQQVDILHLIQKIVNQAKAHILSVEILLNDQPVTQNDTFIVYGEELLCYSMFANLFKNAIEASLVEASPKEATIMVYLDEKEMAIIRIHNQGSVPQQIRNHFFDKYATAAKAGGTGLGTYSAKLMAETQGGNISLETSDETGTTITIQLPRQGKNGI